MSREHETKVAEYNPTIRAGIDEMMTKLSNSMEDFSYSELMSALVGEAARMAAFDEMPIERFIAGVLEIARFEYARGITRTKAEQEQGPVSQ